MNASGSAPAIRVTPLLVERLKIGPNGFFFKIRLLVPHCHGAGRFISIKTKKEDKFNLME